MRGLIVSVNMLLDSDMSVKNKVHYATVWEVKQTQIPVWLS